MTPRRPQRAHREACGGSRRDAIARRSCGTAPPRLAPRSHGPPPSAPQKTRVPAPLGQSSSPPVSTTRRRAPRNDFEQVFRGASFVWPSRNLIGARRCALNSPGAAHFDDVNALAQGVRNNLCLVLAIAIELREVHGTPPPAVVRRAFRLLADRRNRMKESRGWDRDEWLLSGATALVEAALRLSLCTRSGAALLLTRYLPPTPPRGLSSRFSPSRVPLLRAYCLKAALEGRPLLVTDLAPKEIQTELESKARTQVSEELRELREIVGALLPWHNLWARTLLSEVTSAALGEAIAEAREASAKAIGTYCRDEDSVWNEIALIWFNVLHHLNAFDAGVLGILTAWIQSLKKPLFTPTIIRL